MVINYLLGIVREGQFKWLIGHVRELHGVVKKEKKKTSCNCTRSELIHYIVCSWTNDYLTDN